MSIQPDAQQSPTLLYVLGLTPDKIGGVEIFCREFALQLREFGWKMVVAFQGPPSADAARFLHVSDLIIEVLPDQGGLGINSAWPLFRLIRRYRPAIFMYGLNGVLRTYPWVARTAGIRKIYYNDHSSRPPGAFRTLPLLKRLTARMTTFPVSGTISVSDFVRRTAIAERLSTAPNHVVLNGTDLKRSESALHRDVFRRRFRIPADATVITQVCWIVSEKGVDTFLKAAAIVGRRDPRTHFVLVGDGPQREQNEQLCRELGLHDRVTFTGVIQNPTLEGVFAGTDIACQCSRWQEAFGLAIVEAMSFSVPVVASRIGGIPEIVEDDITGFLVEPEDHVTFADRIFALANDRRLRLQMGAAGRLRVEQLFDVTHTAASYCRILQISESSSRG